MDSEYLFRLLQILPLLTSTWLALLTQMQLLHKHFCVSEILPSDQNFWKLVSFNAIY